MAAWYRRGRVKVTEGSAVVSAMDKTVDFVANLRPGDNFVGPDGRNYEILNAISPLDGSAQSLTLYMPYQGETADDAPYAVMPIQGYAKLILDKFNHITGEIDYVTGYADEIRELAARIHNLSVGETVTSAPGEEAKVSYDNIENRLNFSIPRGEAGPQGEPGADGAPGTDGVDGRDGTSFNFLSKLYNAAAGDIATFSAPDAKRVIMEVLKFEGRDTVTTVANTLNNSNADSFEATGAIKFTDTACMIDEELSLAGAQINLSALNVYADWRLQ